MQRKQMSSSHATKKTEVVTYLEALSIFFVFVFILYILYPKDMLYKQVLSESSNYDLTAVYLENMIRLEPENKTLILALIRTSAKMGKHDLSLKMIEALGKDADESLLKELVTYRFEALKTKYFSTNEKQFQDEVKNEMTLFLQTLIKEENFDEERTEYWYTTAREFSLHRPALFFLSQLLQREKKAKWLEECFYLSGDLDDRKMQKECLNALKSIDAEHFEKWMQRAYYLAAQEGEQERAISLLKEMIKGSDSWQQELAKYYLQLKEYKKASAQYILLYEKTKNYRDKKNYLIRALESLQYGSLMEEAAALARKYDALYYKDKEMSKFLISLYLAAGKLDDAKRISIERLKYME
jgi:hypothetical protein